MYKIYVNEKPLILSGNNSEENLPNPDEKNLQFIYSGKKKFLHHVVDQLKKAAHLTSVTIAYHDVKELWDHFVSLHTLIEAAGGLVINEDGKLLLIHRRGFWDLPKGKIDAGETHEQAAVREVREETGLNRLTIERLLAVTYHTYKLRNKRILKKTYWFEMHTTDTELSLQKEEDIVDAIWIDKGSEEKLGGIYKNILDVIASVKPLPHQGNTRKFTNP